MRVADCLLHPETKRCVTKSKTWRSRSIHCRLQECSKPRELINPQPSVFISIVLFVCCTTKHSRRSQMLATKEPSSMNFVEVNCTSPSATSQQEPHGIATSAAQPFSSVPMGCPDLTIATPNTPICPQSPALKTSTQSFPSEQITVPNEQASEQDRGFSIKDTANHLRYLIAATAQQETRGAVFQDHL